MSANKLCFKVDSAFHPPEVDEMYTIKQMIKLPYQVDHMI